MRRLTRSLFASLPIALLTCCDSAPSPATALSDTSTSGSCAIELVVLGAGQDAGAPQIGYADDPAWDQPDMRQTASSLALIDHASTKRYLFDATPHITAQLNLLDQAAPQRSSASLGLDGIFLTHAHIGHYAGLMFLGREAAGTSGVPVYAMPRLVAFLRGNGPWSQLVALENIVLSPLAAQTPVSLADAAITVTPYSIPHRDEYSETVGYVIETAGQSALYLPDIDSWDEWQETANIHLEDILADVDFAFVDATFFDNDELPGRDMSLIPHPRVTDTMDRLQSASPEVRARVHFIHYNHTNPIRFAGSEESRLVAMRGFNIARAGNSYCLLSR